MFKTNLVKRSDMDAQDANFTIWESANGCFEYKRKKTRISENYQRINKLVMF